MSRKTATKPSSRDAVDPLGEAVATVRRFNRFYTRQIGVLNQNALYSPFTLAEARVLLELSQRGTSTATDVGKALGLDAGYLSRVLRGFARQRLVSREPSAADGRQSLLSLTSQGRKTFASLDGRSREHVGGMLATLAGADRARLIAAMHTIEALLGARPDERHDEGPDNPDKRPDKRFRPDDSAHAARASAPAPYLLRTHQAGDMGWVVQKHGEIYTREYGWNDSFEALVAEIVAVFLQQYDPKRERCWIAECDGGNVGSIFLVKKSQTVAKLRLLLVDPKARGLGIGARLVAECVRHARQVGYKKMTLWTQSNLYAARRLYEAAGFQLVESHPTHSFGHDLVSETWELTL